MLSEGVAAGTAVVLAVVGLAALAVVLSGQAQTSTVLGAVFDGVSKMIQTAVAPVAGGSTGG
jgi:hypothetical protein